jgi:hypothetical protein
MQFDFVADGAKWLTKDKQPIISHLFAPEKETKEANNDGMFYYCFILLFHLLIK